MNGTVCLICGTDDYLVDSAARERINQLVPESERTFGVEIIDGRKDTGDEVRKAVDACMEAVQTPGFWGAHKVTWLRDATFLTGGGRVSETIAAKEAVDKLTGWLTGGLLDGQVLVITATKVLRSSVFFKVCQKHGEVEDFGGSSKGWELEKLASQRLDGLLKKAGLSMDSGSHSEFLIRVVYNTRLLVQEVEKLRVYVGGNGHVTVRDVREITSVGREAEAWDLLDAFGERNPVDVLATLNRMDGQKGIGIMIATMLEKRVRELLVLREAFERKWVTGGTGGACAWAPDLSPEASALLNALPVNPKTINAWSLKTRLPHALKYTLQELRIARFRLLELRERLVSTGLPERFLLETTLLRIIGNRTRSAGAPRLAAGAR